jgi:hypothetical protein
MRRTNQGRRHAAPHAITTGDCRRRRHETDEELHELAIRVGEWMDERSANWTSRSRT